MELSMEYGVWTLRQLRSMELILLAHLRNLEMILLATRQDRTFKETETEEQGACNETGEFDKRRCVISLFIINIVILYGL